MKFKVVATAIVTISVALAYVATHSHPSSVAASAAWSPYKAIYRETIKNPGQPVRILLSVEERSADGSLRTVEKENGREVGGNLWLSSGDIYALNFEQRTAVYRRNEPRHHLDPLNAAPLGSKVVANVACTEYPVSIESGHGALCVDSGRDIVVRQELHTSGTAGKLDYVKELISLDLSAPGEDTLGVPSGFMTSKSNEERIR